MNGTVETIFKITLFLKKKIYTSNGSRFSHKPQLELKPLFVKKKLLFRKKRSFGIGMFGKKICRTKSRLKNNRPSFYLLKRFSNLLSAFVISINLNSTMTKLVGYALLITGGVASIQLNKNKPLFSLLTRYFKTQDLLPKSHWTFFPLYALKSNTQVSFLEKLPNSGIQYVRSSGTSATIITFNPLKQLVTLELPSTVKKVFSIYSIVATGAVSFSNRKLITDNKAGSNLLIGKGPIVRGVAKNPIDHPHGGRTKAIRYPRTPWGKTTKFK